MRRKEFYLAYLIESFFQDYLVQQRKVSRHTISSYRDTFRLLLPFAATKSKKTVATIGVGDLNVACILAFLRYLEDERKCSSRSRNQRLAAIKSFFRHVMLLLPDKSHLAHQVLALVSKRGPKKLIVHLTTSEVEALLKVPDRKTWVGRRDHMLILLGVETGLRVSELLNLRNADVDLGSHPSVFCLGKGRKERRTPLGKASVASLREWMKERRSEDLLFTGRTGHALISDAVQALLKKYQVAAGRLCPLIKNKRLSAHILRHTAAMTLFEAKVDLSVIALWLGHSSIDTTMKEYIRASLAMKERALQKTSPTNTPTKRYRPNSAMLSFLERL